MTFHTRSLLWLLVACFFTSAATGCRQRSTVPLSGNILLDARPLSTGTITLIPIDRAAGPSVGANIADGRYEVPAAKGPLKGQTYRVEIRSVDPASASTNKPNSQGLLQEPLNLMKAVFKDRIPAAYNTKSQLTLSIPADAAVLQKDFELKSR
jgi:hypothetical protein